MSSDSETQLDLKGFFPYQFSILAQQMSEYIAQIYKKYDLSKMEWRVLATIGQHTDISAREICQFTHFDKMQVSRAIAKLMAAEYLSQQISDTDRRTISLKLSSKGIDLYQEIIPLVRDQEQRLLQGLTDSERQMLRQLTLKLSGHLASSDVEEK
ncbi:MAG: MarR family transcriptional regulator [Oceanospirillaceae bacterium]|nr:MarR family transcriptional regulator [Oceanospirillaceae bacterium]